MKAPLEWVRLGVVLLSSLSGLTGAVAQPSDESRPENPTSTQPADLSLPDSDKPPRPDNVQPLDSEDVVVTEDMEKAWNQGVPMEDRQAARELFLEGNRLFRIPLYNRAAETYQAALIKWKNPAFYFNLALAQSNLGQDVEARESLEHALEHGDAPLGAERFQEAQRELAVVTRKLGRIRLSCRTLGAEITLDGKTLFTGPGSYEGWIKASSHELTAKKTGYQSEARRVTTHPQQVLSIDLSLITLTHAADISRRWATWKPWLVIGTGGAILAAGGVFHAFAASNFNYYDDKFVLLECAQTDGCSRAEIDAATPTDLSRRLKRATWQQRGAIGAYITGGAIATAGLVLWYLNQPRLTELQSSRAARREITIIPMIAEDMAGVFLGVRR